MLRPVGPATAQTPNESLHARVESFLRDMSIPAGYYELRVTSKSFGHPHILEMAEKHRSAPFYEALRNLGEEELRGGRVQEQTYAIWHDGRRWAVRDVGESLHVNEARYVPHLAWEGFNDEYHWHTGGTQLNIEPPDEKAPAFHGFDAKQKLWPLVSGGLRQGDMPDPLPDLSTVEPIADAEGRIAQVRATFVSRETPSHRRVCLIECDQPGEPARIVQTASRYGSDERAHEFATSDWREIVPGSWLAFRAEQRGTWDGRPIEKTIELVTYRPLEITDEDAFYPPAPSTVNEVTGKPLFEVVEDRRQTPPQRYSVNEPADRSPAIVTPPPAPSSHRLWVLLGIAGGAVAVGLLWRVTRRRTN